ncbi:unnamed protein product [Caretta caretta]
MEDLETACLVNGRLGDSVSVEEDLARSVPGVEEDLARSVPGAVEDSVKDVLGRPWDDELIRDMLMKPDFLIMAMMPAVMLPLLLPHTSPDQSNPT